ncbi:unnamed protein product [Knipowitschia caucasica]|uniref:Uncharacterized protein n=1 Tax=Knipowitschia caucasica TaxID=637954 RepID=A0AAV2KAT9_KNICA
MNKGQRASSSSDSDEKQQSEDEDSKDLTQHGSSSSTEKTSSSSDVLSATQMKRSQGFNCSFSFEEDQAVLSQNGVQTQQPESSRRASVPELGPAAHNSHPLGQSICETQPPRSSLFRPQGLWLAVTRCLSIRWPPCLSLNRMDRSNRKLAYQKDFDQSQKSFSSDSLDSANPNSSILSTSSEDINVTVVKKDEEEAKSREVKRGAMSRWGVSRSSPRLPRDRQVSNLLLASMILERDMFLTVELIDRGEEEHELRYQAEWKLTEKSRELAAGLWPSRTLMD